jgi:hypothetical protein
MNITPGLINGLLLLARLYPKSKATTYGGNVFFEILAEDNKGIRDEDKKLLESWGWCLTESEDLEVWDW